MTTTAAAMTVAATAGRTSTVPSCRSCPRMRCAQPQSKHVCCRPPALHKPVCSECILRRIIVHFTWQVTGDATTAIDSWIAYIKYNLPGRHQRDNQESPAHPAGGERARRHHVDAVGRRCAAAGQGDAAEQAGACGAGVCESAAWKEAEGAKGGPRGSRQRRLRRPGSATPARRDWCSRSAHAFLARDGIVPALCSHLCGCALCDPR